MYVARTIALIVCATSVLTSSVSETTGTRTAGSSGETRVDHVEHIHEAATPVKSEKNLTNDNTHKAPATESGAPSQHAETETKNVSKSAVEATVVAEGIKLTSDDLLPADPKSKLPKIRTASVVARKGAIPPSKISPRKGVGPESAVPTVSSDEGFDEAGHSAASSSSDAPSKKIGQTSATIVEKSNNDTKAAKTEKKMLLDDANVVASTTDKNSTTKGKPTIPVGSVNVSSTTETKIPEATSTSPPSSSSSTSTTRRFKPKPTVTIGEMDIDKPIPASPTKTPPLGMPRKIDYIVPVIITIMALPLLGGAAFFLYRRGRDCWDKRHYRRMDFLIDGMYNDYSWK